MPVHEIQIRPEVEADADAITRVITDAFENHPFSDQSEARIVRDLRSAEAITLSLVAVEVAFASGG